MSIGSIAAPSALRQLRGLSGQQAYELWLDGGPSRWGSLSAPNQQRWEDFARFLEEHAVMHVDAQKVMDKIIVGGGKPLTMAQQVAAAATEEERLLAAGMRPLTDQQLVDAADLFLRGAVALSEEEKAAAEDGDVSMFDDVDDGNSEKFKVQRPDGPYEVHSEVTAAIDTLAKALKNLLAK